MNDTYAYLTEFEDLLVSFQTNPDLDINKCLLRHFTTPDNMARFMGFCQAIFRLDADKYHRDFAVGVMAASGMALSDLAREQTLQWCRENEYRPRIHTSGYRSVLPGTGSPLPEAEGPVSSAPADTVGGFVAPPPYGFMPRSRDVRF